MSSQRSTCWQNLGLAPILIIALGVLLARASSASPQGPDADHAGPTIDELPQDAIWRIENPENAREANGIYRLRFSQDGKLLATRDRENVVTIFNTQNRKQLCEVSGHENNWIETIDFSPDAKKFVTAAGSNERVKIWNSQTGKLLDEIDTDAKAAYFAADGTEVVVLGPKHVEHYAWPGGQQVSRRSWRRQAEQGVAMSADGELVVAFRPLKNPFYQTQVIDLENNSKIDLDGPRGIPKCVVISPNKLWVAASYHPDPKFYLWDLRDPHKSKYVLAGHTERVQSLAFSPDN